MRIFITGASGYLGGAVAERLIGAGHEVIALARSERSRERVEGLGAKPAPGGLEDLDVLRAEAAAAEAVVHAAVDYRRADMGEVEGAALEAMLDGLSAGRPFIYTSSGLVYPDTRGVPVDEDVPVDQRSSGQPFKILGERRALGAPVAGMVIRAALVYGRGGSGLLQMMLASAARQGVAPYIAAGANEWSSVHVDDLATLFLAMLEQPIAGAVVNAASGERTAMRRLAEAVAGLTGARAVSLTREEAVRAMGPSAAVLTRSSPLDSSRARRLFGWNPAAPGLLDELTSGSYARAANPPRRPA